MLSRYERFMASIRAEDARAAVFSDVKRFQKRRPSTRERLEAVAKRIGSPRHLTRMLRALPEAQREPMRKALAPYLRFEVHA